LNGAEHDFFKNLEVYLRSWQNWVLTVQKFFK
jgi:hypothetical protein